MGESGDDGDEKDEDDINDDAGDESGVKTGGEHTIEAVEGEDGGHRGDNVADDAGGLARLCAMGLVVSWWPRRVRARLMARKMKTPA